MWPNQDETVELLNGAQKGDREAVDRLLDRHRNSLHRMVECRLNQGVARRVDASDIVQDALLTASRRLADYLKNPNIPFHAWLRQITRDRLAGLRDRIRSDPAGAAAEMRKLQFEVDNLQTDTAATANIAAVNGM